MMSEEKSKGIRSLRRKKTTARPKISAPITQQQQRQSTAAADAPSLQPPPAFDAQRSGSEASILTTRSRSRPSVGGGVDKTADLVKRRYSTRFAQLPHDSEHVPPVPGLPPIPAQFGGPRPSGRDQDVSAVHPHYATSQGHGQGQGHGITVDTKALRDPNLPHEQYVARLLADATEADIASYRADLKKLKNRTSTDLQHNVYQNRNQFIKISKEADKLKTEMRTMRSLMSDLTTVLSQATSAGSGQASASPFSPLTESSSADRKRANRTSVANLEALWSTHLQALWKRVEGAQKYLPAVPGRHVVHESARWLELNAATWKPRRRAHLILLNDHLLFATEKKRIDPNGPNPQNRRLSVQPPQGPQGQAQSQTHLVAERCWPLQDVHMADISTRAENSYARPEKGPTNAINVRVGNESWTFATASGSANTSSEGASEISALLIAFKKASEQLRKALAAEHGERERLLDEMAFLAGDSRLLKKANMADGIDSGNLPNRPSTLIDVDGRQQSLRWVESQIDTLDIDIALQHFEDAVARTEKLRKLARNIKGNAVAQDIITIKLDQRASKLAAVVARRLRHSSDGASAVKESVGWLVRLGFEELARVGYLEARKDTMRKRTRQIPFTGSLPPHLTALSYVTFALILHTFRTFSASFPTASSSAVVKWAKERIDEFNDSLGRHLSTVERGSALFAECVEVVKQQSRVLVEVGVDFSGLVAKGLVDGEDGDGGEESGVGRVAQEQVPQLQQQQQQQQRGLPASLAIGSSGAPVGLGLGLG